jgi:hypothetical protein
VNPLHERFQEYFAALDRNRQQDRCYICLRTGAEVKLFLGFNEDGLPVDAAEYGIEDITILDGDIMSYRGPRPVCAVCQLNVDMIQALDEGEVLREVLKAMETHREELWPPR